MSKKFKSDEGFTLIEVMIAMTILTVGLMSIAVAQLTAIKVSAKSKHLQEAMFLAREEMDTLAAIRPEEDPAGFLSSPQNITDPDIQVGTDVDDYTRFTRRTVITPGQPSAGLSRVVVTVTWDNANTSGISQIQLSSVMRNN